MLEQPQLDQFFLQALGRGVAQRALHFGEQRLDEHVACAVQVQAHPAGIHGPAQALREPLGQFWRPQVGVCDAQPQHVGERLPGALLGSFERGSRPAPSTARASYPGTDGRDPGPRSVQRAASSISERGPRLFRMMEVDHQVINGTLEEVAKSTFSRVGVFEVTAQESQRELLGQVVGRLGVAERGKQIAMDGAPVALHQARPLRPRCPWCAWKTAVQCVSIRLRW